MSKHHLLNGFHSLYVLKGVPNALYMVQIFASLYGLLFNFHDLYESLLSINIMPTINLFGKQIKQNVSFILILRVFNLLLHSNYILCRFFCLSLTPYVFLSQS